MKNITTTQNDLLPKTQVKDETIHYLDIHSIRKLVTYPPSLFWQMTLLFLYETGARVSEALGVKVKDYDTQESRVKLLTLKQSSKKERLITLSSALQTLLLRYIMDTKLSKQDFLFTKKTGNPSITRTTVNHALSRFIPQSLGSGYDDYAHPHMLRHSRAIHLLDSGMNIRLVQNFLGHTSLLSTLVYLQYSNKDLQLATQKANLSFFGKET